jgi:hypothetical protein
MRAARPRWSKGRRRWYAYLGKPDRDGRRAEVYAPRTIGEHDEAEAWAWMREELAARMPPPLPDRPPMPEPEPLPPPVRTSPGSPWLFGRQERLEALGERAGELFAEVRRKSDESDPGETAARLRILRRRVCRLGRLAKQALQHSHSR